MQDNAKPVASGHIKEEVKEEHKQWSWRSKNLN